MRNRNLGLSLVELMVAVTLALITIIVVMQVLSVYEARKRTTTVGNDAQISASVGVFMLDREIRMAGAGLTLPSGFACAPGMNGFYDGATFSDGAPRAPLRRCPARRWRGCPLAPAPRQRGTRPRSGCQSA